MFTNTTAQLALPGMAATATEDVDQLSIFDVLADRHCGHDACAQRRSCVYV